MITVIYLVIMMAGSSDGGRFAHTVEFRTQQACEDARAQINSAHSSHSFKPVAICAPRDHRP